MYRERMNEYYPQVIQSILEFQSILDGEAPEFEALAENNEQLVNDAYLTTMSEDRVLQWETLLGIKPLDGSTLENRRDTIVARVRGQGKLNSKLINTIVNTFTGGSATSWVKDGVLYVEITPSQNNKTYLFESVEQELKSKVPAHLGFKVSRNYYTWGEIETAYPTWQDVEDGFASWNDVLLFIPF